jgi:hypothetical protein
MNIEQNEGLDEDINDLGINNDNLQDIETVQVFVRLRPPFQDEVNDTLFDPVHPKA